MLESVFLSDSPVRLSGVQTGHKEVTYLSGGQIDLFCTGKWQEFPLRSNRCPAGAVPTRLRLEESLFSELKIIF